jgi:pimeloyl-ACP methyl ester carboxylesterase
MVHQGCFIATGDVAGVAAARVTLPRTWSGGATIIVPPIGYEYSQSYHAWPLLAARLAREGQLVVRLDLPGIGDSALPSDAVHNISDWQRALRDVVAQLRHTGATHVTLLGCRVGATMCLLEAHLADAVVALAPVLHGRRYNQELRLMSLPFPDGDGRRSLAGYVFAPGLLEAIGALRPEHLSPPTRPTLIVARGESGGEADLARGWQGAGCQLEVTGALELLLTVPSEVAQTDPDLVSRIAAWVTETSSPPWGGGTAPPTLPWPSSAVVDWRDRSVVETYVTAGPDRLHGVLTSSRPIDRPCGELLVFLNSGSDPHPGPARSWVELARELVDEDRTVLRVDYAGWGDSPRPGDDRGRPYEAQLVDETRRLVDGLHADGWDAVILAGLCAGAWVALQVARAGGCDGVVALNPQLYYELGQPFGPTLADTRSRRLPEIEHFRTEAARGRWDEEDARGLRPVGARWLDDLADQQVPVAMIFAQGDDGIEFLRDRLGRRLDDVCRRAPITVAEVPDVDHGMHRAWLKQRVFDAVARALDSQRGRRLDTRSP